MPSSWTGALLAELRSVAAAVTCLTLSNCRLGGCFERILSEMCCFTHENTEASHCSQQLRSLLLQLLNKYADLVCRVWRCLFLPSVHSAVWSFGSVGQFNQKTCWYPTRIFILLPKTSEFLLSWTLENSEATELNVQLLFRAPATMNLTTVETLVRALGSCPQSLNCLIYPSPLHPPGQTTWVWATCLSVSRFCVQFRRWPERALWWAETPGRLCCTSCSTSTVPWLLHPLRQVRPANQFAHLSACLSVCMSVSHWSVCLSAGSGSDELSDLSMAVLFDVWLLSCSRCFPSHSLWLRGRQMLSSWRHQPEVVEQWSRVITALTSRCQPTSEQTNKQINKPINKQSN